MWTWLSRDAWQGRSRDGGMVFAGNGGIVPSRRWELMRMGLEDWLLLDMARQAGHSEQVNALVTEILEAPDNPALLEHARSTLIRLLSSK